MNAMCDECGAGPFKRLASHLKAVHNIASKSNAERLAESRRRRGVKPPNYWTPEQDALILERPDLSYAAIGRMTGHTKYSAEGRGIFLRNQGLPVPRRNSWNQRPTQKRGRRLLAQTCSGCGLLLDAEWFHRREDRSYSPKSVCRVCSSDRGARINKDNYHDLQRKSLEWVVDPGREYTDADVEVLSREDIDCLEMARLLKRSYASVTGMRQRLGLGPAKPRLAEPVENWVIRSVMSA